jgi:hypothetical protein
MEALHQQRRGAARHRPRRPQHCPLPTFVAGAELRDGGLCSIMTNDRAPELTVCAFCPPTRYVPPDQGPRLLDFLVSRFAGRPNWQIPAAPEQKI